MPWFITNLAIIIALSRRSFSVLVKNLDGKNHQMTVLNLLYPIDEKDSYKKVNKASSSVQIVSVLPYTRISTGWVVFSNMYG